MFKNLHHLLIIGLLSFLIILSKANRFYSLFQRNINNNIFGRQK